MLSLKLTGEIFISTTVLHQSVRVLEVQRIEWCLAVRHKMLHGIVVPAMGLHTISGSVVVGIPGLNIFT